jgi:peptidoglycan hydrolase-like protein with peptidoglycan-binding domain
VGAKGDAVVALQTRLNQLGFWVGAVDGIYADGTRQAVFAAQKIAGISADGLVGPQTAAALNRGITHKPRSTSGHVIEIDKKRQVLLVVDGGKVTRFYNASTGGNYEYWSPTYQRYSTASTPSGTWKVYRQVSGWDKGPLGSLYAPMYFTGGIAVHGTSADVADSARSHGCVRVTVRSMDELRRSGQIAVGVTVTVY